VCSQEALACPRGHTVSSRGHTVTSRGHTVSSRGHTVTSRGHSLWLAGLRLCPPVALCSLFVQNRLACLQFISVAAFLAPVVCSMPGTIPTGQLPLNLLFCSVQRPAWLQPRAFTIAACHPSNLTCKGVPHAPVRWTCTMQVLAAQSACSSGGNRAAAHVPYRDSKLTSLLWYVRDRVNAWHAHSQRRFTCCACLPTAIATSPY